MSSFQLTFDVQANVGTYGATILSSIISRNSHVTTPWASRYACDSLLKPDILTAKSVYVSTMLLFKNINIP